MKECTPKNLTAVLFLILVLLAFPASSFAESQSVFGPKDFGIGQMHFHLSVHPFNVEGEGDGVILVTKKTPQNAFEGGFLLLNSQIIGLHDFLEGKNQSTERKASLRSRNFLTVFLRGTPGATISIEVKKGAVTPAPQVIFQAVPQAITLGETSTLQWTTTNADRITIDQGIGNVSPSGSWNISPLESTTYMITVTGPGGSTSASVDVSVHQPPTVTLSASPQTVILGATSTLSWNSTHADTATIDSGIGNVSPNGSLQVVPQATTNYTITVNGPGGSATASLTIEVEDPFARPTVSISANPSTIPKGGSSSLSWVAKSAQSAHIDKGIGAVPLQGFLGITPEQTTTYTITVIGSAGAASAQVTVMVTGIPEPQPEGSFGARYEDLVPSDATLEKYDTRRFCLITGLVQDVQGSPLMGVSVTILHHPEYGTAITNDEGRFSIPVEGGGTLTLVFHRRGLIPAHRKVHTPWNDTAIADTLKMIPEDEQATVVTLDGNLGSVTTHQSTPISDPFGTRSCTMVFKGDNKAYAVDEDGNDIAELKTISVRATEFATSDSMPAILPPTSAYTYCADLKVGGVDRVRFKDPVVVWVDNFLGFDVGESVPAGYYDKDSAVWIPSENGVVVELLDTNGDGAVDALDRTGDHLADEVVSGLEDPERYSPGSTFWRVQVSHFSPYDFNWPWGPPPDSITPNPEGIPSASQKMDEQKDCKSHTSSFVEERSGVFHEDVPIPGTNMTLHYASDRVDGNKTIITVPASGSVVPASLNRIVVKLTVAGKTYEQILPPEPQQKADFLWDGKDYLGRTVEYPLVAQVGVGFEYEMVFFLSSGGTMSFGRAGLLPSLIRGRDKKIYWKTDFLPIQGKWRQRNTITPGWTVSAHHHFNPEDPDVLHKGDGTILTNKVLNTIHTIAGTGARGYSGDRGPATQAMIYEPRQIAVDAKGDLYIADSYNSRIRKIDRNGIITTVAGCGRYGDAGDGGPALDAELAGPVGVALDGLGNLFISDKDSNRIRKVNSSGIITTIAGNGVYGYGGDGGPATEAQLSSPRGIAVDAAGNLYIADLENNRIRKVDPSGFINTIAGNDNYGLMGDGGPAVNAQLAAPGDVALDTFGNLYIADSMANRIRKVDPSGIITTVGGSGRMGFSGDGASAIQAKLNGPLSIAVSAAGNIYFGDSINFRIRMIDTNGLISTVAGIGINGSAGDGGPAVMAQLGPLYGVAVNAAGHLHTSEGWNHRIRKVSPPSVFSRLLSENDVAFAEENGLGYIMSTSGQHKSTIDTATGLILLKYGYDSDGNLVSITDQFQNEIKVRREESGVPFEIVSPDGLVTTLTIDSSGHLARITYPNGAFYSFEYIAEGLMTTKIDQNGNRFHHNFDEAGRLVEALDQEGGHWIFERNVDAKGDTLTMVLTAEGTSTSYLDHNSSTGAYASTITDFAEGVTLFDQSSDGLSVSKSQSCGMALSLKYDQDRQYGFRYVKEIKESSPSGLSRATKRERSYYDANSDHIPDVVTDVTTVNNKTTRLTNDIAQTTKKLKSPLGRTLTAYYDPRTSRTAALAMAGLHETGFSYDSFGRLKSILVGTRETNLSYDTSGFLSSLTDPEGHTTGYTYDPVGRVKEIQRPDGSSLSFDHDNNGNMTLFTSPSGVGHYFDYNGVNLNRIYEPPLSGIYAYTYNNDRQLTEINFPSGLQIKNTWDKGRVRQIQTPEGNIDLTYLCSAKVGSMSRGGESIAYGYDGSLVTLEAMAGTLNQSLSYTYDNDFNVKSFSYAGATNNYSYDNDGLLVGSGAFAITRNAGNGLPEKVAGGSLNLNRVLSGYAEIESQDFVIGGTSKTVWNVLRDKNGRIIHKAETVDGVTSQFDYTYDTIGRLRLVVKDGAIVEEYQYGANGARIYEVNTRRGISGRSFSYSAEDHLLSVDMGGSRTTYEYDVDGFLTKRVQGVSETDYRYSSRGELLEVVLPDGRVVEYVHDPLGRRIAKKVNGAIVEKYLWQGMTRLLAVYDGTDNLLMRFEYADDRVPMAMTKAGAVYYLTHDQVGSLRVVTDASGNIIKRIDYDSFGNVLYDSTPGFAVPLGFAGGLYDRDIKLVRFGFRDYDPDIGRWTAKDPILFNGGSSDLYGYVEHCPISHIDSVGLKGGALIPIRTWLKKNLSPDSIIGSVLQEAIDIPLTPSGILLFDFLNPRDAGIPNEDFFIPRQTEEVYDHQIEVLLRNRLKYLEPYPWDPRQPVLSPCK